jgi:hypothetical protein
MAIATFDKLLRPILDLANREDTTRKSATAAMIQEFRLSPAEAEHVCLAEALLTSAIAPVGLCPF